MAIAFLDLKEANSEILTELEAAALRVVRSGWFIGGPEVDAFEQAFAAYVGAQHCVGTGNGLEALVLALLAVGVKPGDEVIVPAHTFIATWLAVTRVGGVPVPVSVDENTYVMELSAAEAAITPRTKAIIPVHLYGYPAPMPEIMALARKHGLKVVEDAAQAQGAALGSEKIGGHGDAVCWSFYPAKNLGALGDAGSVTTNDSDVAKLVRQLGNYGSEQKYVHDRIEGGNSRLDSMQAALLGVKLKHLEEGNAYRRALAETYKHELAGLPLGLTEVADKVLPAWHLFVVRTTQRDALQAFLQERGISTQVHYPIAIHDQKAYAPIFEAHQGLPSLLQARRMAAEVLSLPFGPHHTEAQVKEIAAAVRAFFGR